MQILMTDAAGPNSADASTDVIAAPTDASVAPLIDPGVAVDPTKNVFTLPSSAFDPNATTMQTNLAAPAQAAPAGSFVATQTLGDGTQLDASGRTAPTANAAGSSTTYYSAFDSANQRDHGDPKTDPGVMAYGRMWTTADAPPAGMSDAQLVDWQHNNPLNIGYNPGIWDALRATKDVDGSTTAGQAAITAAFANVKPMAPIVAPGETGPESYLEGGQTFTSLAAATAAKNAIDSQIKANPTGSALLSAPQPGMTGYGMGVQAQLAQEAAPTIDTVTAPSPHPESNLPIPVGSPNAPTPAAPGAQTIDTEGLHVDQTPYAGVSTYGAAPASIAPASPASGTPGSSIVGSGAHWIGLALLALLVLLIVMHVGHHG